MCSTHLKTSRQRRSIHWLWVEGPTKKLPLLGPVLSFINCQTCVFSPPWSVCTLDDQPYSWVAFRNTSATVPLYCLTNNVSTNRENPSIAPWITNPRVIRLWWPSRCQRLFDPATEYARRETVIAQRILTLRGSTHTRHLRTRSRCIFNPSDLQNDPKPSKFRLSSHVHSEKHWLCCPIVHQWCRWNGTGGRGPTLTPYGEQSSASQVTYEKCPPR